MATFEALEALLSFREGGRSAAAASKPTTKPLSPTMQGIYNPPSLVPRVPNPLDPTQPHLIEGDAPTPNARRQGAFGGVNSAFSPKHSTASSAAVSSVLSVPNPLAAPVVSADKTVKQLAAVPLTVSSLQVPPSTQNKLVTQHGFGVSTAPATHKKANAQVVEVRSAKIRDALNSKPQRGKKRQNLSDFERQELTRTRNREHARSTR